MADAPSRTFSWREVVEQADDKDRHRDSLYPEVYYFGNGAVIRRDSGPTKGIYETP
jgi:hypothetical protein